MTQTSSPETSGRAFVQYVDDEGGEVSLPGYLDARPSIVAPGDVFSVLEEYVEELTASDRFVVSDVAPKSPNEAKTKAELGEILGVDPSGYTKDDLVALADDRARMYPPVPGESADPVAEATPIPGQDVDPFAAGPDPVDSPVDPITPEGENA